MRRRLGSVTLAVAAALAVAAPAQAAKDPLNAFRVKPTVENKKQLAEAGFDLTEGDRGKYLEIYARAGRRARCARTAWRRKPITRLPGRRGSCGLHRKRCRLGRLDAL